MLIILNKVAENIFNNVFYNQQQTIKDTCRIAGAIFLAQKADTRAGAGEGTGRLGKSKMPQTIDQGTFVYHQLSKGATFF